MSKIIKFQLPDFSPEILVQFRREQDAVAVVVVNAKDNLYVGSTGFNRAVFGVVVASLKLGVMVKGRLRCRKVVIGEIGFGKENEVPRLETAIGNNAGGAQLSSDDISDLIDLFSTQEA